MKNNDKTKEMIVFQKESIFKKIKNFINKIFNFNKKENFLKEYKNVENISETNIQYEIKNETNFEIQTQKINNSSETLDDTTYYKMIYNKMNEGEISVIDLTPDEFLKVMQMQKVEYELITQKLKNAMDNF